MEVGQVSEIVEIAAAAGGQVQTENAKISSQVSNKQIDQLPLVVSGTMRSPFDLTLLTPESKPIGLGGDAGVQGPGYTSNFSTRRRTGRHVGHHARRRVVRHQPLRFDRMGEPEHALD